MQDWKHTNVMVVTEQYLHSLKAFSLSPAVRRLRVGKNLGGDIARTGDPSWPKGCFTLPCMMFCSTVKAEGKEEEGGMLLVIAFMLLTIMHAEILLARSGLTSVWQWEVVNEFFLLPLCLQLLLSPLNCHYFNSQDILPSFCFLPILREKSKPKAVWVFGCCLGTAHHSILSVLQFQSMGFGGTNSAQQIAFCQLMFIFIFISHYIKLV